MGLIRHVGGATNGGPTHVEALLGQAECCCSDHMCVNAACAAHHAHCRLKKAVDYWKEQAGLITADAKAAADLFEVENRRCDSPAVSTDVGLSSFSTPPAAAAAFGSSTSSVAGSRPGTGMSRAVGSAIALQLQAAAADAAAPMGDPAETDAGTEVGSIAGEQDSVAPPSSRSLGNASSSGSESEL